MARYTRSEFLRLTGAGAAAVGLSLAGAPQRKLRRVPPSTPPHPTGVIPTPFYTYVHSQGRKWEEYGEEKMKWMFAHRSFLDYGIPVAPGSDYVPGPFEPMMALQSMVTRKDTEGCVWGGNQRVSVDEALPICTRNGAYASFEEKVKGSITAGKYADFVLLGQDPHQVDPDKLEEIPVVRTVVGGNTMHPQA